MSHRSLITLVLALAAASANAQTAPVARAQPPAGAQSATAQPASDAQTATAKPDAGEKRQAAPAAGDAKKDSAAGAQDEVKTLSGISILGNQDSPKSLVIVPWKSSEIGDMPGLSRLLDDSVQPIDKEVFMRELEYFDIRSKSQ